MSDLTATIGLNPAGAGPNLFALVVTTVVVVAKVIVAILIVRGWRLEAGLTERGGGGQGDLGATSADHMSHVTIIVSRRAATLLVATTGEVFATGHGESFLPPVGGRLGG